MEKLKIPQGKYYYAKDSGLEYTAVKLAGSPVMIIDAEFLDDNGNCDDIVLVASDALNTYQQFESLPSELLRQNMEMKEALEKIQEAEFGTYKGTMTYAKQVVRDCLTSCNKGKE